ncbi:glycosyltransferase [Catellatospora paridis]|uniref:glycosyltransferase n=1 Tax=Catellatospora paridis TaxID=1617086 RepID=UPI001E54FB64|nr:glycosyltransferase [Catellatospora paridis]
MQTPDPHADSVSQVFLTRFNLPSQGVESLIRAKEGWLHERIGLFERFTVPSVRAQTVPVKWIVYLDPESPAWLLERLAPFIAEGLFEPIYRESVPPEQLAADVRRVAGAGSTRLITTNIDNDDGLAADFAERVRAADPGGTGRHAIYVAYGLVHAPSGLYLRKDPTNAFVSVAESWDSPVTCWAGWHNLLGRQMPTVLDTGAPTWLQVIHERNVSNRVRGRLVDPRPYRARFGNLLDEAEIPSGRDRLRDRLVHGPVRATREAARAGVKAVAFRLLGQNGFDRAKHLLGRLAG